MADWVCPSCQAPNGEDTDACFACGKSVTSLTKGSILAGRYEILETLGTGGMGTVYKAHDKALDEVVAVKILRTAHSPEMSQRFRSEIKLARKVSHRNVCRIHEYGVDGLRHFISMEFIDGVDLRRHIAARGGLPVDEALDLALQIGKGLQAIHDAGVVHRDLKASNIMLDGVGMVRLMDFGIAKQSDGSGGAKATAVILGTPEYMSPEQALGASVDFRSDVYSFAIVIYELLTGHVPFLGHTPIVTIFKHLKEPPPLDGLPVALLPVLRKALSKAADDRYATVRGMTAALRSARAAASSGPTAAERATAPDPRPAAADSLEPGPLLGDPILDTADLQGRIETCIRELTDSEAHVRWRAAAALWEIGPPAASAAAALKVAMNDREGAVAEAAAKALRRMAPGGGVLAREAGPSPPSSNVEALIQELGYEDVSIRRRAAADLGALGPGARPALALGQIAGPVTTDGEIAALVAALAEALKDTDEVVRERAAHSLRKLGPRARAAVPALIEALEDREVSVANEAASALEQIVQGRAASALPASGPPSLSARPAIATLIEGLKHRDSAVRWRAAVALGESGPRAAQAVTALAEALDESNDAVRWEAAKTLGRIGGSAKGAVPALAGALHEGRDSILRRLSAEALGAIGPEARHGVPALVGALKDSDTAVGQAAAGALLKIGREAVPALIDALKDEDAEIRARAAEIVTTMGRGWSPQKESELEASAPPPEPLAVKRRSPRLDIALRVRLRRPEARAGEMEEELTVTENLSEGGARLVTSLPAGKGEIVDLEEVGGPLRARALVLDISIGHDKIPRLHLQFFNVEPRERLQEILERGAR